MRLWKLKCLEREFVTPFVFFSGKLTYDRIEVFTVKFSHLANSNGDNDAG